MNKNKEEKSGAATVVVALERYDDAFKRQAVEHWLRSGRSGTQIAKELGISYPSLKEWKRRYDGEAAPQRADLELAYVSGQRDISKKACGILSAEPSGAR